MNHTTLINCTVTRAPEMRTIERDGKTINLWSFTVVDPGWKRDVHLSKFVRVTLNADSPYARDIPQVEKGSKVTVAGRLDMREWEGRDGKKIEFDISRPDVFVVHGPRPVSTDVGTAPAEPPDDPWGRRPAF